NDDEVVRTLDADLVVGAADLAGLESRWLPEHLQTYPRRYWERRTTGPGAPVLLLGIRGSVPELARPTLMYTRASAAGCYAIFGGRPHIPAPASLYACRPTATEPAPAWAPVDHENLYVLVPVPADTSTGHGGIDGAGSETVEAAADRAIRQIGERTGVTEIGRAHV